MRCHLDIAGHQWILQATAQRVRCELSNLVVVPDGCDCVRTDGEEQDQQTKEEAADGTGMGEGRGDRDVSDQIEDEEQLLGLKQDKFDDDDDQEGDQVRAVVVAVPIVVH